MMTEQDMERIAAKVAEQTIRKFLLALGVASSDEKAVIELQKDFAHIRESRLAYAAVRMRAAMVVTGVVVTGVIAAVVMFLSGRH